MPMQNDDALSADEVVEATVEAGRGGHPTSGVEIRTDHFPLGFERLMTEAVREVETSVVETTPNLSVAPSSVPLPATTIR
jgi:hypothetical protein